MTVPQALHTFRHDTKNRALITLVGEIDLSSTPMMGACLARCLHDGIRTIDIDLSAVTFCDCSGLNAFLTAALLTGEAGGCLRLHYPSAAVSRLFTLTGSAALFRDRPGTAAPDTTAALADRLPCAA